MPNVPQRVYGVQRVLHMRGQYRACQRGWERLHVRVLASVTMSKCVRA